MKSRLLRIAAILLCVLLFAGFFAFSTFLYSPFEGALSEHVAALVPRDVDFFVGRADLASAFGKFPHLALEERLVRQPAWQAWADSAEGRKLAAELKIEETLQSLETQAAELPFGMQPQEVFGGQELAVAGYFRGRSLEQADWAVYGRTNWLGKLGAALLSYPKTLRLEQRGIKATVSEGQVALSGGGLPREVFVGRIKDVVIVATKPELLKAAYDLRAAGYADSFYQSANYNDWIQHASRSAQRDEFELFVNTRKLLENLGVSGPWPDTKSQDFTPALLGRLFQLPSLKNAIGVLGSAGGLQFDLHGEFSAEHITGDMARVYRARGFDKPMLEEVARLAPRDTGFFAYLHAPVGEVLRMVRDSMEPALRQNIEDQFRGTGRYANLDALVNELDGDFKDRWCLIVRPNDYPGDPEGPPHSPDPVPAIALVLWTKNPANVEALEKLIGGQGPRFGLQGKDANSGGFFSNMEAGYQTYEFWTQLGAPGTGVIVAAKAGEMTIVTNSLGMMGHLLKTYSVGGEKYPRLSEEPRFSALLQSSIPKANLAVWVHPQTLIPVLRQSAEARARSQIHFEYKDFRPGEEQKVLRDEFGGKKAAELSADDKLRLSQLVGDRLDAMRSKMFAGQVPELVKKEERVFKTIEACSGALFLLALDPKSFDLSGRVLLPMQDASTP
jgi:hypothetical protein